MQVRLLRLLEAGSLAGGDIAVDFRVLPTHRDLYYRPNVFAGPPAGVRERREDVVLVS